VSDIDIPAVAKQYQEDSQTALAVAVARSRSQSRRLALLVVQVDQIEKVSTAMGHMAGTRLAEQFCEKVRAALRGNDVIVPVGGTRFWIILDGLHNHGHAELAASRFHRIGRGSFRVAGYDLKLDPVIGMALFPDHAGDTETLMRCAELALGAARDHQLPYRTFSESHKKEIADLWEVEHEFDRALEEAEFELFFQPKIDLASGAPCGAEALLRWNNPVRGLLAPAAFLPIAEKYGKLEAITWFVIDAAQRQRGEWPGRWGSLPVAVNIPPSVLDSGKLRSYLQDSMRIWGTEPGDLTLEITEDAVVRNPDSSFAALAQLRREGIRVSIDDFGSGYSSMTYFKNMPADELKIDRSFTLDLDRDEANQHIVRSIIDLAHLFNYKVIAEGVETDEVLRLLSVMQCDVAQGYVFSRPLSQPDFMRWLDAYRQDRS
jgi:diguanylate cyclase (GGDEF)-like protein